MIKELMHDPIFLADKSEEATKEEISIANICLKSLWYTKKGTLE